MMVTKHFWTNLPLEQFIISFNIQEPAWIKRLAGVKSGTLWILICLEASQLNCHCRSVLK